MKNTTSSRRFAQSEALRVALYRQKIALSGSISTLLLETFLEDSGRLLSSRVVARGLCEEGYFGKWRKDLIDKGWLVWSETQSDKGLYYPGKKLIPYINKEKAQINVMATQDSVESLRVDLKKDIDMKADKSELQDLKAKMNEIAEAVQNLQIASTPPDDDIKKKMREESTAKLVKLASVN
jgi:hypothetical protein